MFFHHFREPCKQPLLNRDLIINNHLEKIKKLTHLLLVWRVFFFHSLTEFCDIRLVIDGCSIPCSNHRSVGNANIVRCSGLFFLGKILAFHDVESLDLLQFSFEIRRFSSRNMVSVPGRIDYHVAFYDVCSRAEADKGFPC